MEERANGQQGREGSAWNLRFFGKIHCTFTIPPQIHMNSYEKISFFSHPLSLSMTSSTPFSFLILCHYSILSSKYIYPFPSISFPIISIFFHSLLLLLLFFTLFSPFLYWGFLQMLFTLLPFFICFFFFVFFSVSELDFCCWERFLFRFFWVVVLLLFPCLPSSITVVSALILFGFLFVYASVF